MEDSDFNQVDSNLTFDIENSDKTAKRKLFRQQTIRNMAKDTKRLLNERRLQQKVTTTRGNNYFRAAAFIRGKKKMDEIDNNGWAHVHHAAFRGFVKSVERFIQNAPEQLELETDDGLGSTPLLLACMGGSLDTVKVLVDMGAKIGKLNTQRHGVVELSAYRVYVDILNFFTELGDDIIPAWSLLIKFAGSDFDEEAEACAKSIRLMIEDSVEPRRSEKFRAAHANGLLNAVLKVIKGTLGDEAKCETFRLVHVLLQWTQARNDLISGGIIPAMVRNLKSNNTSLLQLMSRVVTLLAKDYAEQLVHHAAIPAIVRVLQTCSDGDTLAPVVESLGAIATPNFQQQTAVATCPGALAAVVELLRKQNHRAALEAACYTVAKTVRGNRDNQNAWASEGGLSALFALAKAKYTEVQTAALEAITCVAQNNVPIQNSIIGDGAIETLIEVLSKARNSQLKERSAMALWALAGENAEYKKRIATMMGISLLVEFVNSPSENLNYIGSEAVRSLARGPRCKESVEISSNVVAPLVRLLCSEREAIVLSGLQTIRQLCVSVGYIPNTAHQDVIVYALGAKLLVAIMVHCTNELLQAEAAHTLGCLVLGNAKCLEEVKKIVEFSYVRIIKMLYSSDHAVRLLAGSALAAFAFNSNHNLQAIVEDGGVRFQCFLPFIQSDTEIYRCCAAFQVVVLAPIMPDENSAISCAAGLKLLADLLAESKDDEILMLTCDCIARLAHTRSGIAQAMGAIGVVEQLIGLLASSAEPVRGSAAVALGFLSYNFECRRLLIVRCRADAMVMPILRKYMFTDTLALSPDFMEAWRHFAKLSFLPKINTTMSTRLPEKKKFRNRRNKKSINPQEASFNSHILPPVNLKNSVDADGADKSYSYTNDHEHFKRSTDFTYSSNDTKHVQRDYGLSSPSKLAAHSEISGSRSRFSFASESISEAIEA